MRPLLILACLAATAMWTRADDKIWSAVVLATNSEHPKDPPAELRAFGGKLKRTFGYNQYAIVGAVKQTIDETEEHWVVPSPNFWFSVKARQTSSKEARGGYLLDLGLFQDKRLLVNTTARLAPDSPLFIRGPACGKGHLLIVLQVQH